MQAGDKLSFVRPFDPSDALHPTDDELDETAEFFIDLSRGTIRRFDSEVRTMPVIQDEMMAVAYEVSLRLPALDGSYLHIVIFGHHCDEGLMDTHMSIVEHLPNGDIQSGYLYTFAASRNGVVRSDLTLDEGEEEEDRKTHFSLLELHLNRAELDAFESSDDPEQRKVAKDTKDRVEEDMKNLDLAQEMGYNVQPVDIAELEQIGILLCDAEAFPPSMFPEYEA